MFVSLLTGSIVTLVGIFAGLEPMVIRFRSGTRLPGFTGDQHRAVGELRIQKTQRGLAGHRDRRLKADPTTDDKSPHR